MNKLKIGWFTFTCSEDNIIILVELLNDHYFEWKSKIDFVYCRVLKSKNELKEMDIAFVEGAISSNHEEYKLKEIRSLSKKLVAVGACACTGMPSGNRNLFDENKKKRIAQFLAMYKLREKVQPVKDFVNVDDEIPGCPMAPAQFVALLERYFKEFNVG